MTITRAREELIVFATLGAEQIDLTRTSATAVEHLKEFLKYAEVGPRAIAEATTDTAEHADRTGSALRRDVAEYLRDQGWGVDLGVGCSGYEIDIAVRDPDEQGAYLLSIEMDGESYRLGETARDRERTRPLVLESLGWRLHRIWSVEWWHDREKQLRKLDEKLERLKDDPPVRLETSTNRGIEIDEPGEGAEVSEEDEEPETVADEQREWVDDVLGADVEWAEMDSAETYELVDVPEDVRSKEAFDDDGNLEEIGTLVQEIAAKEGPVSVTSVARRVARYWGYARLSSRIEKRIRKSVRRLDRSSRPAVIEDWIWPPQTNPADYETFRPATGEERPREADEIPPHEAANAAAEVLSRNLAIEVEELQRQVADAFGYSRLGGKLRELGEEAIELLVKQGRATRDGEMVRVGEGESNAGEQKVAADGGANR